MTSPSITSTAAAPAQPSDPTTTASAPAQAQGGKLTQGPSGYTYGYEAPAGGMPPYLSDGELMRWLEMKSEDMYTQVRAEMGVSTERSKLMQDLTQLKSTVDSGKPIEVVVQEMAALDEAYAGTDYADEVATLCGPEAQRALLAGETMDATSDSEFKLDEVLSKDLEAQVDRLSRDDRIALVHIQDLMAELRETAQLTSNLIANNNETTDRIVGNV